ncbi:M23 family metallopeptidase [Mesonia maritima]|uniref:Murein DD-endopeptidase MepM/ murein hydrolase activator NlpD n=1 Tax=Mesonia maritima TaxID=1793873 RepID=A0ABU1K2W3_9FLAO|nr:M23 family metallopeptidase [Mesonia maritima]MDR6299590.1 murein DD-endopeptidase MepM/ murein hydrolase activator NlpD [Mesonia maritima]
MKKKNILPFLVLFSIIVISCSKLNSVTDAITNPNARKIYSREFKDRQPVFDRWKENFENAKQDSLQINLPYAEKGTFFPHLAQVYSYTFNLQKGTIFTAEIEKDSSNQRIFIDLFGERDSTFFQIKSNEISQDKLSFTPNKDGNYKIIIQPEIAAHSNFFISFFTKPTYYFPVAGKGNSAIQSFWGNARDGGKRSHEGIDIFAEKGTPVVAAVNGRISRTGNRGLDGKQVWLRAGLFGNSLYYAHLDSIIAKPNDNVKIGDTLGLVGNTGNAKTTPPHLHFGIYRIGAKNPLPYIFKTEKVTPESFVQNFTSTFIVIKTLKANLREGPSTSFKKVGELTQNDTLQLLGEFREWLHVKTFKNQQQAFIHESLVKMLE